MSIDLDLSLDTLIGWKRKPHAIVEDLLGVKPDPWQQEALEAFPTPHVAPCDMDRLTAAPPEGVPRAGPRQTFAALT
jgi:hypothetical protein